LFKTLHIQLGASVSRVIISASVALAAALILGSGVVAQPPGVAYLAIDLTTYATAAAERPGVLDTPILAGSVMKIATLAAALESGTIDERTGIVCTRRVSIDGHALTCTHPDLHRPLRPAEALAHSCNVYFAAVASRLPRSALDRSLASLGLPPSDPARPVAVTALGIGGAPVTPRRLLDMIARVAANPSALPWRQETLAVVREGLRGAAQYGTASALAARGVDAMAKTGTTVGAAGVSQGIVVGVTPSAMPAIGFVLLASGGAGVDAAALAADRLAGQAQTTPGTVRVGAVRANGGYTVRTMPLEEYVAAVLAGEAARDSSPAALEALAITIRTFAMANRGRHGADGFDLCDSTHCQVLGRPTPATERAAAATAGRVLLDHGAPAAVFYSASCGGHTEHPSAVWPNAADPPFLPSRVDDACAGEPAWDAELTAADLARALRAGGFNGDRLRDLSVISRTSSGRVAWLRLGGLTPGEISGQDFRTIIGRVLGWQHIKSTAFDVRRSASGFRFAGHGSGHGVGLCVIGSVRLAARGQSAETILARYFPGLQISELRAVAAAPRPDVFISLPAGDEGEREVIHDLAVRARDAVAATLGVAAPSRIVLRFHPTVESYQRATGQPWFTTAATRDAEVQFVPLTVLRAQGLLERTVRHELVHVLTEPALAGRPLWVREGAASYFSGERPGLAGVAPERGATSRARPSCPTDRELHDPVSRGALGLAYDRAAACFANQIESGKAWREIR
jgi:stage II sporulation protein D